MGNCFGSSKQTAGPPPSKKQRKEQPYVTDQVISLRSQADNYHQKVASFAKESQQAYKGGDKSKAHQLSEQKKSWQTKQDDANKRAAQLILKAQQWQTSGEIDLHGFHLDEAMDATRDFLKFWSKKMSSRKTVLIITGAGHHSEDHKPVIRPKVQQLLRQQGHSFKSVHGDGAFEVTLMPSQ